ncbi:response regulator transcription factor [Halioxenophilus sp. WMMB6]|uniref:response regulator transcription factor n=1 Tax=Halioxenophilus sp. WMMB6 TaxID=3073815 RepID=UPI00295F3858|nr:response regulator transcription factor [Halioxenophilus sp. WMMB6]
MSNILLVDDDKDLCNLLTDYLNDEGFSTSSAHDGSEGLALIKAKQFDAVILDVMLPFYNGFELITKVREISDVPLIMLTAKGDSIDRIIGLDMGADDYVAKPCNPRELVARINAILRRLDHKLGQSNSDLLEVNGIVLNRGNRSCLYNGNTLNITGAEFSILDQLMSKAGNILSKESLTERALSRKLTPYDRSIDVHVSNIRKKLSSIGVNKDQIINVRGAGYMFTLPGAAE